jgi:UDP-glucose 4-epimerase
MVSKKILITGASGFIGKHLLNKLLIDSYDIACIDLQFNKEFIHSFGKKVELFQGNLLDKNFIVSCIKEYNPNFVYHLAGSKSRSNTLQEFKTSNDINYIGTLNLFESCIDNNKLERITILGTIEEYGKTHSPFKEDSCELPTSAYGLSKLSATKLSLIFSHQFNLPILVLRPSITYGPGQGVDMFIPALIKSLLRHEPFRMTEGMQLRDFVYVDDLIEAMIKGIEMKGLAGNIINIASGTSVKLRDVALNIASITGNVDCLEIGAIPYRQTEIMDYEVNINKANDLLKWYPKISLEEGLVKTIDFYKKHILDEA